MSDTQDTAATLFFTEAILHRIVVHNIFALSVVAEMRHLKRAFDAGGPSRIRLDDSNAARNARIEALSSRGPV